MAPASSVFVERGDVRLEVTEFGAGDAVVLLPSLGRGPDDFRQLTRALTDAGYRSVLPAPRGIGDSTGPLDDLTLHDLAADVAAVIEACDAAPAFVLGHAFGNRVARTLAADRPDLVRGVILLAAGGQVPIAPDVLTALRTCVQNDQPDDVRLPALQVAFFGPGHDPAVWLDGWWPQAARGQMLATQATDVQEWWTAGSAPVLVVQALQDRIAPADDAGRPLAAELGARCTLVELDNAGHAMLPEQPDAISEAVIVFLRGH